MESEPTRITAKSDPERISVELSARRTGMSFQRTRMSADRTLMSVIRTSLSLIGFGFTIFQFFQKLHEAEVLKGSHAARVSKHQSLLSLRQRAVFVCLLSNKEQAGQKKAR